MDSSGDDSDVEIAIVIPEDHVAARDAVLRKDRVVLFGEMVWAMFVRRRGTRLTRRCTRSGAVGGAGTGPRGPWAEARTR